MFYHAEDFLIYFVQRLLLGGIQHVSWSDGYIHGLPYRIIHPSYDMYVRSTNPIQAACKNLPAHI
jgi:hypothetical protein